MPILVTLYVLSEGARGAEDGPLLFYRTLGSELQPGARTAELMEGDQRVVAVAPVVRAGTIC